MEMAMVMVIVGIIAAIFSIVINSGFNSWLFIKGQKNYMMDASSAMRRMVREMRRISNITISTSTECQFQDISNNTIDYKIYGAGLMRNDDVLLGNLADNGLQFIYLDDTGAAAAFAGGIKTIQILLIVQDGRNRVQLQSAAGIRNK